jgi:NAD(P)-dependent dehydrogenase (short-subunit alcohol dehydrogenase family)
MAKMDDKVGVITGGNGSNGGIGSETARQLVRMDIAVVIGCLEDGREADETLRAEEIEDVGDVRLDITRPEDRREIVRHLEDRSANCPQPPADRR